MPKQAIHCVSDFGEGIQSLQHLSPFRQKTFIPVRSVLIGTVIVVHALISVSLLNRSGLEPISDEGVYLTLAKALATTGEYKIISLPGDPYHTKYPVLYPWLLSVIWRVSPDFPSNITHFRLISVGFSLGFLLLLVPLFPRLVHESKMTSLLIGLCALNPAVISSSTAILSETAYLFFSYLALVVVSECDRRGRRSVFLVFSAFILALAFYVRITGIALIAATMFHLILKKRWVDVAVLALLISVLLSPWLYWCCTHNESTHFPEYIFNTNYLSDFRQLIESQGLSTILLSNVTHILFGIAKLLIYPFQTDLRLITYLMAWLGLPMLALLLIGFFRSMRNGVNRIAHWYLLVYFFMLLLWPYPAGERFLLPLLPLLYLFILIEMFRIVAQAKLMFNNGPGSLAKAGKSIPLVLFPLALLGVNCLTLGFHSVRFTINTTHELKAFEDRKREMIESFQWIKEETRPSDFLMAYLHPVYYLYTGRKTAPMSFDAKRRLTEPKFVDASIRKHGIKYLVVGELDFGVWTPDVVQAMSAELRSVIDSKGELRFQRVFTSKRGKYAIYKITEASRLEPLQLGLTP